MACGARGVFTKLCAEPGASPHTFDTNSEPLLFDVCTLGKYGKLVMQQDNTGSRSMLTQMVRQGPYTAMGDIRMRLNAGYLDNWLPRILGGAEVADVFDVAENLSTNGTFGLLASKEMDTEQIKDCLVSRAVIRGQAAEFDDETINPIEFIVQVVGKEHTTGTSYPSLTHPSTAQYVPYIFEEATFTINSVARQFYDFTLTIDNRLSVRFANQLYPVELCPIGRRVSLTMNLKYETTNRANLFEYPDAGHTNATLVFTKGAVSTTFTFAVLKGAVTSPVVRGQGEYALPLNLIALKTGSTSEIVVTNDSTP